MGHAAEGDCEQVHGRWIGQPVNTVTSLAYVAGAAWVLRPGGPARFWAAVLAWLGLGSAAYHGPGGKAGKAFHDSGIVALVVALVVSALADRRPPNRRQVGAAALLGAAAGVHTGSRTGCRGCRPDSVWQGHGLWHLLSAAAVTLWADASDRRDPGR